MDYETEKKDVTTTDAVSVSSVPQLPSSDDELDPVMLHKAFKFAAWSSIILVSVPNTSARLVVLT